MSSTPLQITSSNQIVPEPIKKMSLLYQIHLSICQSIHLTAYPSIHLHVCSSIHPSIHPHSLTLSIRCSTSISSSSWLKPKHFTYYISIFYIPEIITYCAPPFSIIIDFNTTSWWSTTFQSNIKIARWIEKERESSYLFIS